MAIGSINIALPSSINFASLLVALSRHRRTSPVTKSKTKQKANNEGEKKFAIKLDKKLLINANLKGELSAAESFFVHKFLLRPHPRSTVDPYHCTNFHLVKRRIFAAVVNIKLAHEAINCRYASGMCTWECLTGLTDTASGASFTFFMPLSRLHEPLPGSASRMKSKFTQFCVFLSRFFFRPESCGPELWGTQNDVRTMM